MPGPRPTPTALLAARGSWRASERQGEPSPNLPADCLPPESLDGRALDIWTELAQQLHGCGLLTSADLLTFERYCRTYAVWESAMKAVEEEAERNAVLTLAKVDEMLRRLEANFGLSPADRTAVRIDAPEATDKRRFFKTG